MPAPAKCTAEPGHRKPAMPRTLVDHNALIRCALPGNCRLVFKPAATTARDAARADFPGMEIAFKFARNLSISIGSSACRP